MAAAQRQLASGSHDAALDTYRTALADVDGALTLDPSNATAAALRRQLLEAMPQLPPAPRREPAPLPQLSGQPHLSSPVFELTEAGDSPYVEKGLRAVAAIIILVLTAVAIQIIPYYATSHSHLDTTPLEQRAKYPALPPPASVALPPAPTDDTIYFPTPGVTMPFLQSKSEPRANAQGSVVLVAVIDPSGRPVQVQVWRGLDPDLNVLAIQAASQWRFRPGTKDGKPVPVAARLEVNFRRQ